jgi:hypothetical protein
MRTVNRRSRIARLGIPWLTALIAAACLDGSGASPSVVITRIPPAAFGGPTELAPIAGRVEGGVGKQRVVLFARSGVWYVQPLRSKPYTSIQPDSSWSTSTHLGSEYAALLVREGYRAPQKLETLPSVGGDVLAVTRVRGTGDMPSSPPAPNRVRFSGYEWQVREFRSNRAGANEYHPGNVRVADDGALHLSLINRGGTWTSAEVSLTRTLGYGAYAFVIRDLSQLDPAAMLSLFTYDDKGPGETYREMNIQLQRASESRPVEGQSIVQPNYLAGNISRYPVPSGTVTHWFRWEPGRVVFGANPGERPELQSPGRETREFTIGVPTTGKEQVRLNLCYVRKSARPPKRDVEVVLERFQYFP